MKEKIFYTWDGLDDSYNKRVYTIRSAQLKAKSRRSRTQFIY